MDSLYYCTKINNTCSKRETCERYKKSEDDNNCKTTLFKTSCTDKNNYVLYIASTTDDINNK